MRYELIIFDLDGTIADTCQDITEALNHCLKLRNISIFSTQEVKKMVGEGVRRLIEKALQSKKVSFSEDLLNELIKCFISYYGEHIADFTKTYPEVEDTLEKLKPFKKAIISNKTEYLTIKTLEQLNLKHYFDFIAGSDSFPEKKPSPLPILKVIEKFSVPKDKTLIVGDSNIDIEAGKSAGVQTVAVTYGYREKELLKDADFMIDNFGELIKIVGIDLV
jgi:phosphoglycolate phosphatase